MSLEMGMLLATVGLVFVSFLTASISYLFLRHTYDPHVIVYATADPDRPTIINLVIKNVGNRPAYDVRFQPSEPLPNRAFGMDPETAKPAEPMTAGPIVSGIPMLAPKDERVITWGQYHGLRASLGDRTISVVTTYSSRGALPWDPTDHSSTSALEVRSFASTVAHRTWVYETC